MKWNRLIWVLLIFMLFGCDTSDQTPGAKTLVVITIDDGDETIYTAGLPVLKTFNFPATFFINTAGICNNGKMNWAQCENLENEFGWEAGGHTLHHYQLTELDYPTALVEIADDWQNLIDHGLSHESFALPSGHADDEIFEIILDYYQNVRNSLDSELHLPIDRTMLGYFVYHPSFEPEVMINRIVRGINNHEDLVILGFHAFYEDDSSHISNCKPDELYEVMHFLSANNIEVVTLKEAMDRLGS